MTGTSSGGRRSRDDYEDTAVFESSGIGTPSGSKRQERCQARVLQSKKCETMDKLNESLQGKIDEQVLKRLNRLSVASTKFKDLSNVIFTTALERFHSHSSRTIFLRLDDENKLWWSYSLGK
ncbi:UNVERIFIED_CONTAM: hypothetical protein Slati_0922400 [Sesamum latifolium]|uniref:Uncharacterized protein n=1 Tax=Sesamum latifolium TaxID=2727402 RepID=A0AAW2XNV7_9LAMI